MGVTDEGREEDEIPNPKVRLSCTDVSPEAQREGLADSQWKKAMAPARAQDEVFTGRVQLVADLGVIP